MPRHTAESPLKSRAGSIGAQRALAREDEPPDQRGWWLQVPSAPVSGHGGQTTLAVTGVTCPAVTVAVATPGWQPERA